VSDDAIRVSWPAFYVDGTSVLWIDCNGRVVNGDWRPDFSEDRTTCWWGGRPEAIFKWAAIAPRSGNYNDVIEAFLLRTEKV